MMCAPYMLQVCSGTWELLATSRAGPGHRFEAHISRPVLGAAVLEVRGGGPMVDGRYLRDDVFDCRVAYRREADAALTMPEVRLLYINLHGDLRFV